MTELETKLGQALTDQAKSKDMFDAMVDDLKQQIAEESKPKLRHGDYGFFKEGDRYLHISDSGAIRPIGPKKSYLNQRSQDEMYTINGNIFDDLTAIQEDVEYGEEYAFGDNAGLRLLLDGDGCVHFRGDTSFWMKDAMPVVRMIQRMHATHQRKEAAK